MAMSQADLALASLTDVPLQRLLACLGYSPEETENICYSVAVHVDGHADFPHPETLESKIVSDADNIDRFGAYRIIQWCTTDMENYDSLIAKLRQRLQTLEGYRRRRVMETETGHHLQPPSGSADSRFQGFD